MIQSGELFQKQADGSWLSRSGFQTSPPQPDACDHDWKKIGQEPMPMSYPSPPAVYIYKCNTCAKEIHSNILLTPKETKSECEHNAKFKSVKLK
jgi:hypothetical protein